MTYNLERIEHQIPIVVFYYNFSKEQYGPGAPASELKKHYVFFKNKHYVLLYNLGFFLFSLFFLYNFCMFSIKFLYFRWALFIFST
jgi:hypothetical protein